MAYTPREIKDRVAVGDDIFIVEDLGNNRIRLIPAPTHVSEPGTPVNKALLQPIEDELGRLSSTTPYTQLDHFINSGGIETAQIAGIKNSMFRGKNLGTSYTSEQQSQVASGKFLDLWVGDYWVINGTRYYIAAFNYYYNTGDTRLTTNHIALVPAGSMYYRPMNPAETGTEGGYAGSRMRTTGLDQAKTTIYADFAGHVLTHRRYLSNEVSSATGQAVNGEWFDSDVELMNEVMAFGSVVNGKGGQYNIGAEKSQLPLFALRPDLLNISIQWWLRDVCASAHFAYVTSIGSARSAMGMAAAGVRPVFSIS
jgi:hypothetical protein